MSGGHFDYDQYRIDGIANEVEQIILKNGNNQHDESDWEPVPYSPEVIEEFKRGLKFLRIAAVYAQRIDWLVSGDDGEENFLLRLKNDLKEIE